MNTKQLTVLWYGVLFAALVVLPGSTWGGFLSVALITGALIYTLGSNHSADVRRVLKLVAAPFLALIVAGAAYFGAIKGYEWWQKRTAREAVTIRDVRVSKRADCPATEATSSRSELAPSQSSAKSSPKEAPTSEDALAALDSALEFARQQSVACHTVEGVLEYQSESTLDRVDLRIVLTDATGRHLARKVDLQPHTFVLNTFGAMEFHASVEFPTDVEPQEPDSVQVINVQLAK